MIIIIIVIIIISTIISSSCIQLCISAAGGSNPNTDKWSAVASVYMISSSSIGPVDGVPATAWWDRGYRPVLFDPSCRAVLHVWVPVLIVLISGRDTPPLVSVQVASRQMRRGHCRGGHHWAYAPSRPFQKRVSGCDWYTRDVSTRATRHVIIPCRKISQTNAYEWTGCVLAWLEIIDSVRDLSLFPEENLKERKKNAEEKTHWKLIEKLDY